MSANTSFVLKRLAGGVVALWVLATALFFLLRAVPGGPFDAERSVAPEVKAALERAYRLSDPPLTQYGTWLSRAVKGDLGPSFRHPSRTVQEIVGASLPVSATLGSLAFVLALVTGVPAGLLAALRRGRPADRIISLASALGVSIPRFVAAPLLVLLFGVGLLWLPVARWDSPRHAVLPIFCAAFPTAAALARLTRSSALDILSSDYVRTARAKGLPARVVVGRHVLRAALLPLLGFLGPALAGLLVGSVVVERVFDIPGMGRYFVEAAVNRDYNLVMGVTLVYAALLLASTIAAEVLERALDPRRRDA